MEGNTVSLKITLHQTGIDPEVRRFSIDNDVSTSFTYLEEKLATIFPSLRGNRFNTTWVDQDGDKVRIGSDEELAIALTEMKGPVYHFHVAKTQISTRPLHGQSEDVHNGIICDGCNEEIFGFRYKCMICPDYDLCSSCESRKIHPGHNMIRISSPKFSWPRPFFAHWRKMRGANEHCRRNVEKSNEGDKCPRKTSANPPPTVPLINEEELQKAARQASEILHSWIGKPEAGKNFPQTPEAMFENASGLVGEMSKCFHDHLSKMFAGKTEERNEKSTADQTTKAPEASKRQDDDKPENESSSVECEKSKTSDNDNVTADSKTTSALQTMLNMGFTNEGDWLAKLLDAKGGDIGRVLDALQPASKISLD